MNGVAYVSQRVGVREGLKPDHGRAERHGGAWNLDEYAKHRMDMHGRLTAWQRRNGQRDAPATVGSSRGRGAHLLNSASVDDAASPVMASVLLVLRLLEVSRFDRMTLVATSPRARVELGHLPDPHLTRVATNDERSVGNVERLP